MSYSLFKYGCKKYLLSGTTSIYVLIETFKMLVEILLFGIVSSASGDVEWNFSWALALRSIFVLYSMTPRNSTTQ